MKNKFEDIASPQEEANELEKKEGENKEAVKIKDGDPLLKKLAIYDFERNWKIYSYEGNIKWEGPGYYLVPDLKGKFDVAHFHSPTELTGWAAITELDMAEQHAEYIKNHPEKI